LGIDFGAPYTGIDSYVGSIDIFKRAFTPDWSDMASDLENSIGAFFDVHGSAYLNSNMGVNIRFGLFVGIDSFGQFKMPSPIDLNRGAASFLEAGLWFSTKIRRWTFAIRPSYFMPLAYLKDSEIYTPFPLAPPGDAGLSDMFGKGGVDLSLRGEYPLRRNFLIGGTVTHIPVLSAEFTNKYSVHGDTFAGVSSTANKVLFRPFKLGVDAVYRPFYTRLFTLKPELVLVFNTTYDTPVMIYPDGALTIEMNLRDLLIVGLGTHFEDLIWKQRAELLLNLRFIEFVIGITTKSPQFIETFQGTGFGVDLGVRMGF
jgi:hypothetical protein